MKFLFLIIAFASLTILAYAQDDAVNMADPNMAFNNQDYTQTSAVDGLGVFQGTASKNDGVVLPHNCPACEAAAALEQQRVESSQDGCLLLSDCKKDVSSAGSEATKGEEGTGRR